MNHLDIGLLDGQPVRHRNSSTRPAVVLAVLSSVAVFGFWAATSFNRWRGWSQREREHEEALIRLHAFLNDRPELLMPTMELPPAFRPHPSATINLEDASADHRSLPPVVFLHGEGDAGNNPGMQSVCKTASDAYPGLYVVCANVANGVASISTPLTEQVEEFSNLVRCVSFPQSFLESIIMYVCPSDVVDVTCSGLTRSFRLGLMPSVSRRADW